MNEITNPETGEILTDDNPGAERKEKETFIRTPFNYHMEMVSAQTGLFCPEPTRAQQQFKEDADINTLVERFGITGTMPQLDRIPINEDFVGVTDYHQALNAIIAADEEFMKLPATVRERFQHDAGKFMEFTSDEKNLPEMHKMGLLREGWGAPPPSPPRESGAAAPAPPADPAK